MAYSELQKATIAQQIARSEGKVKEAVRKLKECHKGFERLGTRTVNRMLKDEYFGQTVAGMMAQASALAERLVAEAEGERMRRELREQEAAVREAPDPCERFKREDALLEEVRQQIEARVASGADAGRLPDLWAKLSRAVDRRNETMVPMIADTREATVLVAAMSETLVMELGFARASKTLVAIRDAFLEKVKDPGTWGYEEESVEIAPQGGGDAAPEDTPEPEGAAMDDSQEKSEGKGEDDFDAPPDEAAA